MSRERDLVCQGCCVSSVVVEPLQCTKTKGRDRVGRVRGWGDRKRTRDGDRKRYREERERDRKRGERGEANYKMGRQNEVVEGRKV